MTLVFIHKTHPPSLVSGLFFDQHLSQNYYYYFKLDPKKYLLPTSFYTVEPTRSCSAITFRVNSLDKAYHDTMYM